MTLTAAGPGMVHTGSSFVTYVKQADHVSGEYPGTQRSGIPLITNGLNIPLTRNTATSPRKGNLAQWRKWKRNT